MDILHQLCVPRLRFAPLLPPTPRWTRGLERDLQAEKKKKKKDVDISVIMVKCIKRRN